MALAQFDVLAEETGVDGMMVVDNILHRGYFRTLLPELSSRGAPYRLVYETKANLNREQVRLLKNAGVTWIQPGIEAFHDDLLKLMGKGNSSAMNVEILRHTREFGIYTTWLLLFGFPGEEEHWYDDVADWLPLLYHLQPPKCIGRVLYDRFSPYHQDPARYGLDLHPAPAYASVYPSEPAELNDIAYSFSDHNTDLSAPAAGGVQRLAWQVLEWTQLHRRSLRPVLTVSRTPDGLDFFDTRPCATARRVHLDGLTALVYAACERSVSWRGLSRRLSGDSCPGNFNEAVSQQIERLKRLGYIVELHGKYVALAVPGDCPALCTSQDFPGGHLAKSDPFSTSTEDDFLRKVRTLPTEHPGGSDAA